MRRALKAALLSAAIVIVYATVVFVRSNFCWIYLYGAPSAIVLMTFWWLCGSLFFFLRFRGRVIVILCTVVAYLGRPHIDSVHPVVMAQLKAVWKLREANTFLEQYRRDHPQQGYPPTLPRTPPKDRLEELYKFNYEPLRSRPGGPFDDYLLSAKPVRPKCGCAYRFATSGDGRIHVTTESRPATLSDTVLDLQ